MVIKIVKYCELYMVNMHVKSKSSPFPSLKAHGAALISVSLTLSRTPAEAARPRIRG